ncbi:tyrosine-type recombinase/integrase [Umezawaea sp.]|uniref:tyrosine-type recombinase/integrase n=1 Tax=Umezawaea sp. TaxID=1955258 RepID=UPI002ED31892
MSKATTASTTRRNQHHRPSQAQGSVEQLPSGSWRIRVYAGVDPSTGRSRYASETIPDSPTALIEIEEARQRLLTAGRGSHQGHGDSTVAGLVNRHIALLSLTETTRQRYSELAATHIVPMIGHIRIRYLTTETLEDCYAQLRRCRDHNCHTTGRRRQTREHVCRPLAASTVRKLHFLIGAAYHSALRWKWLARNPVVDTRAPSAGPPRPRPPSREQATRILAAAWTDPDWGPMVWLAMASGIRRGELCALRWTDLDTARRLLVVERSIAHLGTTLWEKDTKLHTRRHILLDHKTIAMLTAYHHYRRQRATQLGGTLPDDAFLFSPARDGHTPRPPATVTQWYRHLTRALGIATSWHKLRHFNATELITAGVDLRTVVGRLGHADGGTTLKYYSAWIREADQRASTTLARLLPLPSSTDNPPGTPTPLTTRRGQPTSYLTIAHNLRDDIENGRLPCGATVPSTAELAATYHVAPSTAHRAITQLAHDHLVATTPGHRAIVTAHDAEPREEGSTPHRQAEAMTAPVTASGIARSPRTRHRPATARPRKPNLIRCAREASPVA